MQDKKAEFTKLQAKFWVFCEIDWDVIIDAEPAEIPKEDPAAQIDDRINDKP